MPAKNGQEHTTLKSFASPTSARVSNNEVKASLNKRWRQVPARLKPLDTLIGLTITALWIRTWDIGLPPVVTWDETYFGRFGSYYVKGEFFSDVHPPLGKLIIGLTSYLAGHNGSFEFEPHQQFPNGMDYIFMRRVSATFGALCVPLTYLIASELDLQTLVVWLVTAMVLFENGYITTSRFILLDSMLLFFTCLSFFAWLKFHNQRRHPFTGKWRVWIILTGVSIGCVSSIKWVGLASALTLGLYAVNDLWKKLGEAKISRIDFAAHAAYRILGFVIIPALVYSFSFFLHFHVLRNSGRGDAIMPSAFQANLKGSLVGRDSPLEVAIGSRVTLRSMGYGGVLLHSHNTTYPQGSKQQQVCGYGGRAVQSEWFLHPAWNRATLGSEGVPQFITNDSVVRLGHARTGCNLHSHEVSAPVTSSQREVSCFGNTTAGDEYDHWNVEIFEDSYWPDQSKVRTVTTSIRLRHTILGCYLRADSSLLPRWGFMQTEIMCTERCLQASKYCHWNIELHWNEHLPSAKLPPLKTSFLQNFLHVHAIMVRQNSRLIPDSAMKDPQASHPWQWPILYAGVRMSSPWQDGAVRYFLLGNPMVYWGSTASLIVTIGRMAWSVVLWLRQHRKFTPMQTASTYYSGMYPIVAWAVHYLPFWTLNRKTYVHHYQPALFFAILCYGCCTNWLFTRINHRWRLRVVLVHYLTIISLFWLFRGMSFGMQGSPSQWKHLQWLSSWKI